MRSGWKFGALVALLSGIALVASPAGAQGDRSTDASTGGSPTPLHLVAQTSLVDADGELEIRFALGELAAFAAPGGPSEEGLETAPSPRLDVVVTVFGRVLDAADLDAEPDVAINRSPAFPLATLPVDVEGTATVRLPIRSGGQFDEVDRMRIPDPGVYPLTVEVRSGDDTLGALRTELIRLPNVDPADDPNTESSKIGPSVALVVPVGADGVSVNDAVAILAAHPDRPATVVLGGDTLTSLRADPALNAAFRAALADRTVVVDSNPELDPSSMAAIGRLDRYRLAVAAAMADGAALDLPVDRASTTVAALPTTDGAAALTELGITRALEIAPLPSSAVGRSPDTDEGATQLATVDGPLAWIRAAGFSAELQTEGRSPAVRAQRILSQLALADPANPVLVNGSGRDPDDSRETLDVLLGALATPEVAEVSLAELVSSMPTGQARPASRPAQDLSAVADGAASAVALLANYEAFYVNGPDTPAEFGSELDAALSLDADPSTRLDVVQALNERLDEALGTIALPDSQTVTLAARSVPIPLTIENNASGTRQVLLRFRSDKIAVAEDGEVITIDPGTSSIDIEVEARSLGVSPLEVAVLTPDGQRVLSTTQFEMRSTAIPGIGLLISAVGLCLLAGWWYISIRRKRSAPPDAADLSDSAPEPDPPSPDRTDVLAGGSV